MAKFFLQSLTQPKIRFQILSRNKETNSMRLKGQYAEFDEVVDKEVMEKYKYTIVKEDEHADQV